jgi:hypothetical protein
MKRIYISGPISRLKDNNKQSFINAKNKLLILGYEVKSPFDITESEMTYVEYMRFDIRALTFCDSIYMLNGWQDSKGARLEKLIAEAIGLKILYE